MFNVVENGDEHLVFRHTKCGRIRVLMRTVMDNTVHIQIQTVELWYPVLGDELRDGRIPLTEPPEEFGDTHGGSKLM